MPVFAPGIVTLQDAAVANGNGTVLDVSGYDGAQIQIVGSFDATVNFEATLDGTNWDAVEATNETTGVAGTTATAAGAFSIDKSGFETIRTRVSAYASGTVTVKGRPTTDADAGPSVESFVDDLEGHVDGLEGGIGAAADAAVTTDTTGTLSGKMRGLVKWAYERMPSSLGQKTKANSLAVTLASDEDVVDVVEAAKTPTTGEFAPGTSAAQFPTITAKYVRMVARSLNTGKVFVGDAADVTVSNGGTDGTTGIEMIPGYDSGWIPVSNLNLFHGIGENATDSVTYMVLA